MIKQNSKKNLRVLTLGYDTSALDRNSKLAKRIIEYGDLVDQYVVMLPAKERAKISLSDRAVVYGVKLPSWPLFLGRGAALLKIYRQAKKLIKKGGLNVVSAQDPFEMALVGWWLAKRLKIGLHIQEHGDFFSRTHWRNENFYNFGRYYLGRFLIKRADSVRAVSARIKNTLVMKFGLDESKIVVVPIYIDFTQGVQSKGVKHTSILRRSGYGQPSAKSYGVGRGRVGCLTPPEEGFIFLTMARMVKQKNLTLLTRAFREVADKFSRAKLVIVGRGREKSKLVALAKKLGLKDRVRFVDWTDDVYSWYRAAGGYVLSSNYEGWGMVIVEAAICGLPIIMTDVGCAKEVVKDGASGLIVPVGDQKKLSEAMMKIIKDKELRKKLGENAQQAILQLPGREETRRLYKRSLEIAREIAKQ